ncbi:MAG: hypothetical protein IPK91_04015 [Saprospiraceae bacterium]|nr:hypothetical protein [Saprospiraceae bacterium]MBK8296442.1 hypothetical protein [Saprospiraceae bacterium]
MAFVYAILIFLVFILFNVYIRVKTFGMYKQLVQNRIQFNFMDLFNQQKWDQAKSHYPDSVELMDRFRTHIRLTGLLFIAVIVIVLGLLFLIRMQA